jgi:ligand-binding sensor domain-containing protein
VWSRGVHDIIQDTLGFVRAATEDGVYRFDGTSFSAFRANDTRHGIPNNTVNDLLLDDANRIYILTKVGFCRYDYLTDRVTHHLPQAGSKKPTYPSTDS